MRRIFAFVAATGLAVALVAPVVVAQDSGSPDRGKRLAEAPVENVLKAPSSAAIPGDAEHNPTVAAGAVKWHADLAAARAAAARSGRPVLLFQLLGQLDQEFC